MKNAFSFILKALFVLKIFKFSLDFFGQVGKRLDRKIKVNLKIYDIKTCLTNSYNTHVLPNISRSKGNQIRL